MKGTQINTDAHGSYLMSAYNMHMIECLDEMILEAAMRTTMAIDEALLEEAKALSQLKTKKAVVEKALEEFIRKRKARKSLDLEGKVELAFGVEEFIKQRRKDVPHR